MNISKLLSVITNESERKTALAVRGFYANMSDEDFLKMMFKARMGKELDLENPKTFNEKLQWLKIYNRRPEYPQMVDKYGAKQYVSGIIGDEYIIPTIGVWDRAEEIDFDSLPNQFVLKCTHDSGGLVICKDKSKLDIKRARKVLNHALKTKFYRSGREWVYEDVTPRIIGEKYMEDQATGELRDYKFFCFNGKVDCVMVCYDRGSGETKCYFFDKSWNLLRHNIRGKNAPEGFTMPKPSNMDEMFDIAAKLSSGLPFARIDLYSVEGKTYFGEITFFPANGFDPLLLNETELHWGSMIDLSGIKA